jgi:methylase of polypeptide subunit release factors
MDSNDLDGTLLDLLRWLGSQDYRFVPPTPETHKRVIARRGNDRAAGLRGAFGWSLPFDAALLPAPLCEALLRTGALDDRGGLLASRFRVASLDGQLFLHSAFPTLSEDAVFLGPDSYRFARFLLQELPAPGAVRRLVDIGAGAGVGAFTAARRLPNSRITITDINPSALRLARINARYAGLEVEALEGAGLAPVEGAIDLVLANPPFMVDPDSRAYRDGGGPLGGGLSLDWASSALDRLAPGGTLLLYTGSAIVDGEDALEASLRRLSESAGFTMRYGEIDPDIFGEELDAAPYKNVERIAAVGAVLTRAP